jgi:Kelch motif protein
MSVLPLSWRTIVLTSAALCVVGCDRSPTAVDRMPGPSFATTKAGSQFVTRVGTQLMLNGTPYRFTGLNIYNANSNNNCWYTMASGPILDSSLVAIGPGKGAFRSWFFQSLATTAGQRDWSPFDHTLSVARAHGVKVIATLANQWADCEPAAGYKNDSWYASGYTQSDPGGTTSYRNWVAEVVTRYRNDPTILAWQLINEGEVKPSIDGVCSQNAAAILKSFATDVSGLIKSIDHNHLVSLGTMGGGQCGAQGAEYQDVHSVASIDLCEYHDYSPHDTMPGDQWNGLRVRIDQCNALGKPLFVGETGIVPNDVGGTFADRASAFDAKLRAQFNAGVVGELVWAWSALGSTLNTFDVGPQDPVLSVLAHFGIPAKLIFLVPPTATEAGKSITAVQVAAVDALGDTATLFNGSVTIVLGANTAGGTLLGTKTVTAQYGIATFSDLAIQKSGSGYRLKASATGFTAITSGTFLIFPAGAARLVFTAQPTTTTAGAQISPAIQVTARDSFGNTAAGFTGNVSMTIGNNAGGGILSGTTQQTAALGTATFKGLTINKAGKGYTLRASAALVPDTTSTPFDIKPATATLLAFTAQPNPAAAGATIAPPVRVAALDSLGNVATGFTGAVTMNIGTNPSGGTLSGTTAVAALAGVATFTSLRIDKAGTGYTLQATTPNRTPATSAAFYIAGPATRLVFTAQPSTALAGATITPPVQVTALDALGNRAIGFGGSVSLAIGTNPGGGTLSGTIPVSAQAGIATFTDLSIDRAGSGYTLRATSGLLASSTSAAFDIAAVGNVWTAKAPMPTARGYLAVGVINGILYAVGGNDGAGNTLGTVEAYNPASQSWSARGSLAQPREEFGVAAISGTLYAVGGFSTAGNTQGLLSSMETYDTTTNTWTILPAEMPTARSLLGVAALNGILYAIGGDQHGTVEAYDPVTGIWAEKSPMPIPLSYLAVAVDSINGVLYALGGYNVSAGQSLATVEEYDPGSNTWTVKPSMPSPRNNLGAGVINGILYAVGGDDNADLTTVEAYDRTEWTTKPSMQTGRWGLGVGAVNGVLYAVGGYHNGLVIRALEGYQP